MNFSKKSLYEHVERFERLTLTTVTIGEGAAVGTRVAIGVGPAVRDGVGISVGNGESTRQVKGTH